MNSMIVLALCVIAAVNAGIAVGPVDPGAVIQGPSSSTVVQGPDGSVISSTQPGGTVVAAPKTAGVVADVSSVVAPVGVVPVSDGVIASKAAVYGHPAGLLRAAHPYAGYPYAGYPYAGHSYAGYPYAGNPHLAYRHLGYPAWAPGSGLEGQWVPDHSETLYDDGQYRGIV